MQKLKCFLSSFALLTLCFYLPLASAAIDTFQFDNKAQDQLFHHLTKILRCPKCQNQNIADSNASLAKDLRNKTYELVKKGQSKDQIVAYMVERYGNFIRYDPPMTPATIFLWIGPLLVILIGFYMLFELTRKQKNQDLALDDTEMNRLKTLLKENVGK
ncbi:MAG: cytochrome c-type biogenesis protein CcmH [Psychromonas sp.]|nr:cytochrome c-type biogenesis protein CcmH [Psychromonas sp.]